MKNQTLKYIIVFGLVALINVGAQAQAAVAQSAQPTAMTWFFQNMVLILGIAVFLIACLAIFRVFDGIVQLEQLKLLQEQGLISPDSVQKVQQEPAWKRWYDKAWNIAPIEQEKDIILAHPHDGIYELDNKLPPWWLALFYGGIVFAVFHIGYNHFSGYGVGMEEEYEINMAQAEIDINNYLAGQANLVDETNVMALTDADKLAKGGAIYKERCVACHGALGEGGIGPNMTDEYWLHGGDIKSIFKTVKYGVAGKGMQAWKEDLTAGQMNEVASYILTLQGTNPPGAKEPQGEIMKPVVEEATAE